MFDWKYYWRVYRPRPKSFLIDLLQGILERLYDTIAVPQPEMIEKAKAQGTHHFVIKAVWEPEDVSGVPGGCWMAYMPDFDNCYTMHFTLPEVVAYAGDRLKIELEILMSEGKYPTMPRGCVGVYDGLTKTFTPNPDSLIKFTSLN